jgi:spermidine synthase
MKHLKSIRIELLAFISGMIVMIYELAGARVLAPYIGNSVYVWTSLIGVILASLSLGGIYGGLRADRLGDETFLEKVLLWSSVLIFVSNLIKDSVLELLSRGNHDVRIVALLAGLTLFAPASILLGIITPYVTRIKVNNLTTCGKKIGSLSAISTLGSLAGTFLAGFYIFSLFRTSMILSFLAIILLFSSFLIPAKNKKTIKNKIILLLIYLYGVGVSYTVYSYLESKNIIDIDSAYNRIRVFDGKLPNNDRNIRFLLLAKVPHSGMYLDSDELAFEYTKYYDLAFHFKPDATRVLMLGGGAYVYPSYLAKKRPEVNIDVVEIDSKLTDISKRYFRLQDFPNLNIIHQEARTYVNNNSEKYDVVMIDVFSGSLFPPFQVATLEFLSTVEASLSPGGIVITNVIGSVEGEYTGFLEAEFKTYKEVFEDVYVYRPQYKTHSLEEAQNLMIVALNNGVNKAPPSSETTPEEMLKALYVGYSSDLSFVLTDEYAPVEKLASPTALSVDKVN